MDCAAKYYYRAIVLYHIGNDSEKAMEELYRALEEREYKGAFLFAAQIAATKKSLALDNEIYRQEQTEEILEYIAKEDGDRFFTSLLCREKFSDYVLQQIDWDAWESILASSSLDTDRIWYSILRHNLENALALWEQRHSQNHGNVVACFQGVYLFFMLGHHQKAEPYLKSLFRFGGMYRLAAVRLWHRFSPSDISVTDYRALFYQANCRELLLMGSLLKKNPENKTYERALQLAGKKAEGRDWLELYRIYQADKQHKKAIKCLYSLCKEKNHLLLTEFFQKAEVFANPSMAKFLKWFSRKTWQWNFVEKLLPSLLKYAPETAFSLCKNAGKEKNLRRDFQQAITLASIGKIDKGRSLLKKLEGQIENFSMWQAWMSHREGDNKTALQMLEKLLDNIEAKRKMEEIVEASCPVCFHDLGKHGCRSCGYRPLSVFSWQENQLQWNAQRLFFPQALIIVTSDSLSYDCSHPVHLILFSTFHGEAQISYCRHGKVVRKKKIGVTPGLVITREENFKQGLYQVIVEADAGVNNHYFYIAKADASLNLQLETITIDGKKVAFTVQIKDFLGYAIGGIVRIKALSPEFVDIQKQALENGRLRYHWPYPHWRQFIILLIESNDGKKGSLLLSPHKVLNNSQLEEIVNNYHENSNRSLPYTIEQVVNNMSITFPEQQKEVAIALQPMNDDMAPGIKRFQDVDHISLPVPSLSGFYLATTRFFPGDRFQSMGAEAVGITIHTGLNLKIKTQKRVSPGERLVLTIESDRAARGLIILHKQDLYQPLGDHFLQKMDEFLAGTSDAPGHVAWEADSDSFLTTPAPPPLIKTFSVKGLREVELTAPQEYGTYMVYCIAGNKHFFAEEKLEVEIYSAYFLKPDKLLAVGMGDCVEKDFHYFSEDYKKLQITSKIRGTLVEREVKGKGKVTISINGPDTLDGKLGNLDEKYKVATLEMQPITCNEISLLGSQDKGNAGSILYGDNLLLAEEIVRSLCDDRHQDTITIAAQIYCAARLYKFLGEDGKKDYWREQIHSLEKKLFEAAKSFPEKRWGYAPGFAPQEEICAAIIRYLSPFLDMPRFTDLHHLAKNTVQAAIDWKIIDNRLFPLSLAFQEKGIKNVESAASALRYGFQTRKALKYLQRHCCDHENPYWKGISLGGEEESTALVCRAYREQKYPYKNILNYFTKRFSNKTLSSPPSTAAFIDILLEITCLRARIVPGNGDPFTIEQMERMEKPFVVEQGEIWCRRDNHALINIPEDYQEGKIRVKWQGPDSLRVGNEFTLQISANMFKYPCLQLLVPANIVLLEKTIVHESHIAWHIPANIYKLRFKAVCTGMTRIYILLKNRYGAGKKRMMRYPVVVI